MSMYVASTQAIIDLLETGIISQQAFDEFYQQTRDLEDDEDIADAIDDWLQSQNDARLMQAYREKLRSFISPLELGEQTLGPGNAKSQTKPGQPSPNSRELLDNIIPPKKKSLADDSASQPKLGS